MKKVTRAQLRVLHHMAKTGGWSVCDPVAVAPRTLCALALRGWVRLDAVEGVIVAAGLTKLGRAAAHWGGHARVFASAA